MKQILFLGMFLLSTISVTAQGLNVDSLVNVLKTQKLTNKEKMGIHRDISLFYQSIDFDKCIEYSKPGLEFAVKTNSKREMAIFNNFIGISYYRKGSFDSSYVYLTKYLELSLEQNDREMVQSAYAGLGTLYKLREDYPMAVEFYMKSLAVSDTINRIQANTLVNLGSVHRALNHWERATAYLEQGLDAARQLHLEYTEMGACHALGNVYTDKGDKNRSIEYFTKSLEISRKLSDVGYEIMSMQSLANEYFDKEEHEMAFDYALCALRKAEEMGTPHSLKGSMLTLAEIYRKAKRYSECERLASEVWNMDSTSISEGAYAACNVAIANIHLGNRQKAEDFIWKFQEIVFKANDKQMNELLANMEIKYETEKKEIRIASLEKERQLYVWLGVAGLLLVIALMIVLWQTKRNVRKEKLLIATRSVLDGEMGERTRLARDLHDRLSGNLSAVKIGLNDNKESLQNVHDKLDTCIEEIRRVAHNLMPASLQFGLKVALGDFAAQFPNVHFHFFGEEYHVAERKAFVLYCCAVELVNNSLRHSGAQQVNLQLVQSEKHISLTVQDNGSGFDEKSATKGLGLKNIYDRVASCDGKIDISTSPDKGTETAIELKTGEV